MYREKVGVLDESLQGTLISGDLTLKRDAGRCARQKWMAAAAEGIAPPSPTAFGFYQGCLTSWGERVGQ
jgi:hypothetical protein